MVKKAETPVEDAQPTDETNPTALDVFFEHQRKAAEQAGKALESLIPAALREHSTAAFKEMVEGYRQLFNGVIDGVVDNIEKVRPEKKKEEEK